MERELEGRVALVTGGASGIGRAIVSRFAAAGARTASLDIVRSNGEALDLLADLRSDAELVAAHAQVERELGTPDILVHSAARSIFGGCLDTDPADFADLYDINVVGAVRLMRLCVPAMRARRRGAIVLLSSINADFATPTLAAYAATKAAVNSLTRTAAVEFAPDDVRVNAIAPASIDTPLLRSSFELAADPAKTMSANAARHPLERLGSPEEVAELALFLVSSRSGWITGGVYPIDGGAHATRR